MTPVARARTPKSHLRPAVCARVRSVCRCAGTGDQVRARVEGKKVVRKISDNTASSGKNVFTTPMFWCREKEKEKKKKTTTTATTTRADGKTGRDAIGLIVTIVVVKRFFFHGPVRKQSRPYRPVRPTPGRIGVCPRRRLT